MVNRFMKALTDEYDNTKHTMESGKGKGTMQIDPDLQRRLADMNENFVITTLNLNM